MKFFPLIVGFLMVFGCNSKPQSTTTVDDAKEKEANKITAKDIEKLKYTDYILSLDSQNAVNNWLKYQELSTQMDLLKKANLSFFKEEKKVMETFIKDFKAELPESTKTPTINARITVLETALLKLHSTAKLINVDKKVLLKDIKDLLIAFANLNLQINKKFELEAQEIDKP
ncbi:MAG: hypothetical protein KDD03_00580 [Gelidibacter sp.]|nr:hypothetical protein [Gelidibacter sp.]